MEELKLSRCAFVVMKLRFKENDYFLMRRDPDWKDINFLGGHTNERDRGKLEKTARRELLEEVPSLRSFAQIDLVPLTDQIAHGPVYSPSARCLVKYELQFFLLRFGESPKTILESLGPRTLNILVRQDDLMVPRKHKVAELTNVLANSIVGGLPSIPHSWPEDLGHPSHYAGLAGAQAELPLG